MLQPKKTKYRKQQKGRIKGISYRACSLAFGDFGIKSLQAKIITNRQIEAARQAIMRHMKREGQLWIRIFPDKPITRKPNEVRMGKGKGAVEGWGSPVKPGRVLFEVSGVPLEVAKRALELGAQKLPVTTKFIVHPKYTEKL
ncbi:MAG: 50S ribosomal protein L16 [Bacteroidales bacterium]|nr:50S ribosomal protein L16 [Bacteroidales bacterium]